MSKKAVFDTLLDDVQRGYIAQYVADAARALRLSDWTVEVNFSRPAPAGAYASNSQDGHAKHCEIRFSKKFLDLDATQQRQVIAHELMHCHLFELASTASECFEAAAPKSAAVFDAALTAQVELATDALADVVSTWLAPFALPTARPVVAVPA